MLRKKNKLSLTQWMSCLFIFAGCLAFAGCNTMEGFGEDVEEAGEGIQEADD